MTPTGGQRVGVIASFQTYKRAHGADIKRRAKGEK
jgi:hypothetical protein